MNRAQVLMIVLMSMSVALDLSKDGQPKTGKHSFAMALMAAAVQCGLLWWAGFWK